MSRKVIFYSTQTNAKTEVNSSATTFGALMEELGQSVSSSMRYYIKENRNSLENLEATLPNEDFTLVASPRNNKAAVVYQETADIPSSQLKEAWTRLTNIINTILKERGESVLDENLEEQEEDLTVKDGWF